MVIIPCVNCGGKHHKDPSDCPASAITSKPKKWNHQIDALAKVPVSGIFGRQLRLMMLKNWSMLDKSKNPVKISSNPRDFHQIDVNLLQTGEVFSWCQWLGINFDDESKARQKLRRRFKKLEKTVDVLTGHIKVEHPYRCSEHPNDLKMALLHTKDIDIDWNDVFNMIGQRCPYPSCNGKIVPHIQTSSVI